MLSHKWDTKGGFRVWSGAFAEKLLACVDVVALRVGATLRVRAVATQPEGKSRPAGGDDDLTVEVDASSDPALTIVSVKASNRPGRAVVALAPSRHNSALIKVIMVPTSYYAGLLRVRKACC